MEQSNSNSLDKLREYLFGKAAAKEAAKVEAEAATIKNTTTSSIGQTGQAGPTPVAGQLKQNSSGGTSIYTGNGWASIGNTVSVVGGGIGGGTANANNAVFAGTTSYNSANIMGSVNGTYSVGTSYTSSVSGVRASPTAFSLFDANGQVMVEIDKTGNVVWPNGAKTDAAAQELSKAMRLGAEIQAGISNAVKAKIRDMVFNEMITIANQRGSLTPDDLTLMLEASKIMEKLKGINIED